MSGTSGGFPVCVTCGVQFEPDHPDVAAGRCPICTDERQYVGAGGQRWTTHDDLLGEGRRAELRDDHGLWGIATEGGYAIGQRALLVPGEGGTLLWDATTVVDPDVVARVRDLGGIDAIALSHPHYLSSVFEWSEAFGGVPVYVHADDAAWLPCGPRAEGRRRLVRLWEGETHEVLPGRTLLNARIHFPGGTLLHWPGLDGRGAVCSGDIVMVAADRRYVSFMWSYPNYVPEHPDVVTRAVDLLEQRPYARLWGAWWDKVVAGDARDAVVRSAHRYLEHIGADVSGLPPLP